MLKLGSIYALQTAGQFYPSVDVGMPYAYAPPASNAYAYDSAYGQPYYAQTSGYGQPYGQPYYGQPIYTDLAQPTYTTGYADLAQPYYAQPIYTDMGVPQAVPELVPEAGAVPEPVPEPAAEPAPEPAPESKQEIPHPSSVKAEQGQYLQTAMENLAKQKVAEAAKLAEEKAECAAAADAAHAERIANLDKSFEEYKKRLAEQSQKLTVQYYSQKAKAVYEGHERKISDLWPANDLRNLDQAHALRRMNTEEYEKNLKALSEGLVPDALAEETAAPVAVEVPAVACGGDVAAEVPVVAAEVPVVAAEEPVVADVAAVNVNEDLN